MSSLGIASGNTPEALAGAFLVNRYGLELVQRLQPDVVLLDIGLPGLDGYEVARRLKSAQICPRLVAITVMAALKTMSGR